MDKIKKTSKIAKEMMAIVVSKDDDVTNSFEREKMDVGMSFQGSIWRGKTPFCSKSVSFLPSLIKWLGTFQIDFISLKNFEQNCLFLSFQFGHLNKSKLECRSRWDKGSYWLQELSDVQPAFTDGWRVYRLKQWKCSDWIIHRMEMLTKKTNKKWDLKLIILSWLHFIVAFLNRNCFCWIVPGH